MSIDVQEAIKRSIQTEKNAMNFYQLGAEKMKDAAARAAFIVLAREEREHAGHFYAIMRSIQTEKNVMNFYQLRAEKMKDAATRAAFIVLAREEREHAGHFYAIYKGSDIPSLDAFLDTPPDNESSWMSSISRLIATDFSEKSAMELAMEREKNLEETLLETASKGSETEVKAVYELNAKETHNHYLTIESEYARIMGMVHETDMDTFV